MMREQDWSSKVFYKGRPPPKAKPDDFQIGDGEGLLLSTPRLLPPYAPDGTVGRACLGVVTWRMLEELRAPLHRRSSMSPAWRKALQPYYFVRNHEPKRPAHRVRGNQLGVVEAFERIRKAAGDFDLGDIDFN